MLIQERETTNIFGLPSPEGEKKRVAYLIRSDDGGTTWHPVEFKKEADVQSLAAALNQMETETAVAALRYALEDGTE